MRNRCFITCFTSLVLACASTSCRSDHRQVQSAGAGQPQEKSHKNSVVSKPGKSGQSADDSDPKAVLLVMAGKIWTARVERDCKTVAQYLDPNEYVAETPEERIEICEKDPFRYTKYQFGEVEVEGQFGWVHVDYETKLAPYQAEPAQEVQAIEKWRITNRQWYPVAARIYETCPESPSVRNAAEEKLLKERFETTWKMRLAKDWKSLYEMTDPKDRVKVSESAYAESEGLIEFYEHELEWAQVMGDVGEVRVTYNHRLADPNLSKLAPRKINLSEHWIKRNGEWYRDLLRTK